MAYNVRIMEKAEEDLSEIVDYISDTLKNQKAEDNLLVDFLHEKGVSVNRKIAALPLLLRWVIVLSLFWVVIMLGIYGVGYDTSGFIYAQF